MPGRLYGQRESPAYAGQLRGTFHRGGPERRAASDHGLLVAGRELVGPAGPDSGQPDQPDANPDVTTAADPCRYQPDRSAGSAARHDDDANNAAANDDHANN